MDGRKDALDRLTDCRDWRSWRDPHAMDSMAIFKEIGLSSTEYETKIKHTKSDYKKRKEEELAQARLEKKLADKAKAKLDPLAGMSLEERSRKLGLALDYHEPYWERDEGSQRISFLSRKARGPMVVPEERKSTVHALDTREKTKNFNADMSTKAKGARGKRKLQLRAELEFHDKQYRLVDRARYMKHYDSLSATSLSVGLSKSSLDLFHASWQGRGRSPLDAGFNRVQLPPTPRRSPTRFGAEEEDAASRELTESNASLCLRT